MISAVTNRGRLTFMVFLGRFTTRVFLEFLRRLLRHVHGSVFLIVDRHPVHRAAKVTRWLDTRAERLRLFLLPSYSPELNPDEFLNHDVKTNALGRRQPRDAHELVGAVRSYLWSMQRQRAIVLLGVAALCLLGFRPVKAADAPPVAAAADLKFALSDVAQRFKRDTGQEVNLAFGSSGIIKIQLENGAPFQMFLSADENYVFQLADKGLTKDRGALYAVGRIVLFAPHGSPLTVDGELKGLRAALGDRRIQRFAIANPEHAPYGRAARSALQHAGLWAAIEPKLVLGENASQAMLFAGSGSSQGGIVPLSLAKAQEVTTLGTFAAIPAEWHAGDPLKQRMVLLKNAGDVATAFYRYVQKPAAREVFILYGFVLPGEVAQ